MNLNQGDTIMPGYFGMFFILTKVFMLTGEVNVNGLQNQSITFLLAVDSLRPVEDVYWIFRNNIIGSYINSRFKVVMDEFEGRLEIQDYGRALRIGQLRLEDSGIYTGTITFTDKTKHTESYNLAVYEPAPVPTIRIVERKKMSEWCNITLNCFVSINTSTLSYVWKYRHRDSNYQLYNISGETIQTSLKNGSWDMEFMCIVKNPIDLKNVSVQKICQEYGGQDRSNIKGVRNRAYYTFLAFLVLPLIFLGWCLYGRRRKEFKRANTEDIIYAVPRMPSSDISHQVPDEDFNSPGQLGEEIVYSTLRHDTDP